MSNREIKLEFDTNETYTVQELARKNGLSPRPCLMTLYELDSSDDYDLTWSTDEEGTDRVIINERDVEPKNDNQKFLADANGTLAQEAKVVANQPKHERAETRKGKRMASVFFSKRVHDQLSMLKIETGLSIQKLLIKALNLLFVNYKKQPIAK